MKVKVLSRSENEVQRGRRNDVHKLQRNLDPEQHPFERAREYVRALNAAKLEKVFAKPFIGALSGHIDTPVALARNPNDLRTLLSGTADGEVRVWDVPSKKAVISVPGAHKGFVRGICMAPNGTSFFTTGEDKTVKHWEYDSETMNDINRNDIEETDHSLILRTTSTTTSTAKPLMTYLGKHGFTGIDHHWKKPIFATCGPVVNIWEHSRAESTRTFEWGADSIISVKFNPVETDILATTASDRNIVLYDLRTSEPLKKLIMHMRNNALAWNPMEAFNFTVANEDHNCYTYDMRKLDIALNVHKDHVAAVMDIDYSPTGREFVTGAYDKTIRIFKYNQGRSREVYHTKRMQRVVCVRFSQDSKYVFSGSDDTNVRIWKAQASEKVGTMVYRERQKLDYQDKLKKRYGHMPEIKRILRHRHLPKPVYNAAKRKREIDASDKRKARNLRAHSAPGSVKTVAERKKHIVAKKD